VPCAACLAGYLKLDLVSVSGGGTCDSSLLPTCLPSLRVGISAACVVSLTPLLVTSTVLVPALWSTYPSGTYAQLAACPSAATTAVDPGSSPTQAQLKAAIKAAFERHTYGADYQQALTSATWDSGTLSLLTASGSCTLKYAVTQVSPSDSSYASQVGPEAVPAACDTSGSLVDGGECMMNLADSCAAGRRPVELPGGGKACALCRAGEGGGGAMAGIAALQPGALPTSASCSEQEELAARRPRRRLLLGHGRRLHGVRHRQVRRVRGRRLLRSLLRRRHLRHRRQLGLRALQPRHLPGRHGPGRVQPLVSGSKGRGPCGRRPAQHGPLRQRGRRHPHASC
jgi:hypothetical protein